MTSETRTEETFVEFTGRDGSRVRLNIEDVSEFAFYEGLADPAGSTLTRIYLYLMGYADVVEPPEMVVNRLAGGGTTTAFGRLPGGGTTTAFGRLPGGGTTTSIDTFAGGGATALIDRLAGGGTTRS
jgi:hypothetical protein